jgi:hypothetical protein
MNFALLVRRIALKHAMHVVTAVKFAVSFGVTNGYTYKNLFFYDVKNQKFVLLININNYSMSFNRAISNHDFFQLPRTYAIVNGGDVYKVFISAKINRSQKNKYIRKNKSTKYTSFVKDILTDQTNYCYIDNKYYNKLYNKFEQKYKN